jgi:hypothetical protein
VSNELRIKLSAVLVLLLAATMSTAGGWSTAGLLALGLFNAVWAPPGTLAVRGASVAAVIIALVGRPDWVRPVVALLLWLGWPPAFAVAWSLGREYPAEQNESNDDQRAGRRARQTLAALIGAVALASIAFRLISSNQLQQTAALFVGIPAILAIVVVLVVPPRSAIGVACKAVTVGLLVSLIFLGEGMLCVVMSAPLFYLVAIAVASVVQRVRDGQQGSMTTLFSSALLLALVPMSLEGVTELTTLGRAESISATKIVAAVPADVERALFEPPRFDRGLPPFLRAGFPSPLSTRIERRDGTARWVIELRGGEMRVNGMEPRTGDLVLELAEATPGRVRWRAVSDTSHMTHFLTWREVVVEWTAADAGKTEVTWTLRYDRGLDPAWYFGPWQRYAVRLAAGYLIDSVATP